MPEHASRFAGLYDQQNENRIPDWGGDELFTRMPTPRAVDDAPAPRFRPSLVLVDAPEDRRAAPAEDAPGAARERAERLGITVIEEGPSEPEPATGRPPQGRLEPAGAAAVRHFEDTIERPGWDALESAPERAPNGRRTTVITGRPDGAPRPLSLVPAERRRAPRTPAEWIGPRPERIVAWAFALGLLLILIAVFSA
jgi:hypothetical protein